MPVSHNFATFEGRTMTLKEARSILIQVDGHNYRWMKGYGLSHIEKAIRAVKMSGTKADKQRAERIGWKIVMSGRKKLTAYYQEGK